MNKIAEQLQNLANAVVNVTTLWVVGDGNGERREEEPAGRVPKEISLMDEDENMAEYTTGKIANSRAEAELQKLKE